MKHMLNIGLSSNAGFAISNVDVESYIRLSGVKFTLSEILLFKHLSISYHSARRLYSDKDSGYIDPPIMSDESIAARRADQSAEVRARNEANNERIRHEAKEKQDRLNREAEHKKKLGVSV